MKHTPENRGRGWLSRLAKFVIVPAILGLAGGYGIHWYQAGQARDVFSPYKTPELMGERVNPRYKAYSFIDRPTDIDFGEIENYKRYQAEWDLVNSGLKPLEMDLAHHDCDVIFNGVPFGDRQVLDGATSVKIAMSWVVADSEPTYSRTFELETNDDIPGRRQLVFKVRGTINPAFDIHPNALDFGAAEEETGPSRIARLLCYRTRNLEIDEFSFSDEALAQYFDVELRPVEDLSEYSGDLIPAAGVDIVVTPKEGAPASWDTYLELHTNLEGYEGLKIRILKSRP